MKKCIPQLRIERGKMGKQFSRLPYPSAGGGGLCVGSGLAACVAVSHHGCLEMPEEQVRVVVTLF